MGVEVSVSEEPGESQILFREVLPRGFTLTLTLTLVLRVGLHIEVLHFTITPHGEHGLSFSPRS